VQPFSLSYRDNISTKVLAWAQADSRISAAAIVGSLAQGPGDRWSDLDLTFAVLSGASLTDVLRDWTTKLASEEEAAMLFDVAWGESIYRVFLLPGFLQLDLSFTPEHAFAQQGQHFKLLFGTASQAPPATKPQAQSLLGYAVHHLLRARICIERGRTHQAEYWLHSGRDYALSLACVLAELPSAYGRGFDQLPYKVSSMISESLALSLDQSALMAALKGTIHLLLQVCSESDLLSEPVHTQLLGLHAKW